MQIQNEQPAPYGVPNSDDQIITRALEILSERMAKPDYHLTDPTATRRYLQLKIGNREHEVFTVVFLNTRNGVIACEELFTGTIDGASVYPREVVKAALKHNAAAVILAHNHPSGTPEPSQADKAITAQLQEALATVQINVLDHLVMGGGETVSFAERGYI